MTKQLYLDDSYLRECDATVVSASGKEVVLDQTIFYPRGGGQPSDTGKLITTDGREFRVTSVMKKDGAIIHELENETPLLEGERVRCVIDWERRYKLMRMHTAAHVLSAMMHRQLGVLITGNQLDVDKTRFDFNLPEFDRTKFDDVIKKTNEFLLQDIPIKIYSLPREEAMKIPGIVKLAGALPPLIRELRIVEVPGVDLQADAGTHVKSLKEVGQIAILRFENKGKENRRVYFTLS